MARLIKFLCGAFIFTMFCLAASAAAASASIEANGVPEGFEGLARDHDLLVDVYFGGRKVGESRVIVSPGHIRFTEPDQVLMLVPNVEVSKELKQAFLAEFPTNAGRVCSGDVSGGCAVLSPQVAGVIFDEDHFRVDLFVNRQWLHLIRPEESLYLSTPAAPLSLTSSGGLALSGSNGTSPVYNLQNRTIVGLRNARIRADVSYASKFGFVADTMVAELDRPGIRYSAGLFWAPGLDLTGSRRMVGVGVGTQFDTRTDRDRLQGTPVVVFLSQPARVDILVDGRLVNSGAYEAGNNLIDTSSLSDGSYSLILRIHEANGAVREERRFFAKNQQVAPVGQPIYFGYAGMLANTRPGRMISLSKNVFYQFGIARRLTEKVALDVSVIGTGKKPILEVGGWSITSFGRVRAAALASARGDYGALFQVNSAETGRLNVNFDLREVWSRDGRPLIPIPTYIDTFESIPLNGAQIGNGSYTQASGSVGYQFGSAHVAIIGSLRKDRGLRADYSIGPNLSWPIVNKGGLQIALQADAQKTRMTNAGYVGVRMLFNRGAYSVSNNVGRRSISSAGSPGSSKSRAVGDTTAHFSYADESGTDASLAGGVTRELHSTSAHVEALVYSRFGSARTEVVHGLEGDGRSQYGLTLQTGAVLNRDDAVFGGRNIEESAMVISLDGTSGESEFDVLINDQSRGRVKAGERLPVFLQPYRAYSVRLRPVEAASVWYDSAARTFTLYPGNVQHVRWHVEHLLTIFGRAFRADGSPVADATIMSRRGVGQSDSSGYFQIEAAANDVLSFDSGNGPNCKVNIAGVKPQQDYIRAGKVLCQ